MKRIKHTLLLSLLLSSVLVFSSCSSMTPKEHSDEELAVIESLNWSLPLSDTYQNIVPIDDTENRFVATIELLSVGVIDAYGNVVIPCEYANIRSNTTDGIYAVATNPAKDIYKWGYIEENGEWLIEPQFKNAYMFVGDYAAVMTEDEEWCIIDRTGTVLSPSGLADKELIPTELEGFFIFTHDDYYGVYDVNHNEIIIGADTYTDITYSGKDNYFVVSLMAPDDIFPKEDDRYSGIYDVVKKELIISPEKYEYITYCNGFWSVEWDMIGGVATLPVGMYLNEDFSPAFDSLMFSDTHVFIDGVAPVITLPFATPEELGEKAITEDYYLKNDGTKLDAGIPGAWPSVAFSDGHGVLRDDTNFYIINAYGEITGTGSLSAEDGGSLGFWGWFEEGVIVTRAYEFVGRTFNGIPFTFNGFGLMNTSGESIVPPIFEYVSQPYCGYVVIEDSLLGYGILEL